MEKEKEDGVYDILKENSILKRKIAYSLGALETVNYLIKVGNPGNTEHLKSVVNRVLEELKKD